jgi:outer membrane protein OmpA-like peptidoglycan-associated protein
MKTYNYTGICVSVVAIAAGAILASCATAPKQPAGSAEARAKLTALQGDANLATRAPVATKDAEAAVRIAETPQPDLALAAHRVYVADHKVDTARALAQTRFAEEQRTALNEQSEKARLDSRTREADLAKSDAEQQKILAGNARSEAESALVAADASRQQAIELQRQLEILQARPTDRGLVLTLGDTLFATGNAELKSGAAANLDRITAFMTEYPQRTAAIEGFTDSMGSDEYNQDLSQRRADSVKRYLVGQGVGMARLSATGRGENSPVGDNASVAGRQQNRRVEVVISPMPVEPK